MQKAVLYQHQCASIWPSQLVAHRHTQLQLGLHTAPSCIRNAAQQRSRVRHLPHETSSTSSISASSALQPDHNQQQQQQQHPGINNSCWQQQGHSQQHALGSRRTVRCQAMQYPPLLSASEISRGLTNADLHLRYALYCPHKPLLLLWCASADTVLLSTACVDEPLGALVLLNGTYTGCWSLGS